MLDYRCVIYMRNMPRVKGPNEEINNELVHIDEPEKQKVRDEQGRITNSHKKADEENLECKVHKSDNDKDVKSGSESNAGSDADKGVNRVIRIENPNRKKLKLLQRLSSLNAFFADTSEPVSLFTHEREQVEKEQQQNYQNVHAQDETEQTQSDLATNEADEATREENGKSEKEVAIIKALPKLQSNSGK